jgi:hypothetical protein
MGKYVVDAIAGEEDTGKALSLLTQYVSSELNKTHQADEILKSELYELRKVVMGDGTPEKALLVRVEKNNIDLGLVKESLDKVLKILIGDEEKKIRGLVDRVYQNEEVIKTLKRMGWVIVATALGQLALNLFGLL